jgi:hypothetical protein
MTYDPIGSGYVLVPALAGELRIGDKVLLAEHGEPWTIYRLDAVSWGRTPAVISTAPNPGWTGPHWECESLGTPVTRLVPAREIPAPRPHGARIASHNPVRHGWYTDPNGYDAACACGEWAGDRVYASRGLAEAEWLSHKATVLTEILAVDAKPRAYLVRLPIPGGYTLYPYRIVRYRDGRWS